MTGSISIRMSITRNDEKIRDMFRILIFLDMDLVRFQKNEGTYTREDRIDVVRIFSKEVEHSEENVELAREECMFDDVIYKV